MLLSLFLIASSDRNKKSKQFLNILHRNHHLLRNLQINNGILMGFNKYSQTGNSIRFQTKMKYPPKDNVSANIIIPVKVFYTNSKNESYDPNCSNTMDCIENYCTYICIVEAANNNISKVKYNDKGQYSLSSLAHLTKDISSQKEKVNNKFSELLDRTNISSLENANISLKSGRHFVISGELDSSFESDNITLILSNNRELSCKGNLDRYYPHKYFLDCDTSISSINADLKNSFAYLENDKNKGFIINFDQSGNSTIETNDYPKKKSSGISTGGIIAIVIPCIILLLLAVGLVFSLRNRAPNPPLKEIVNNSNTIGAAGASSEVVANQ